MIFMMVGVAATHWVVCTVVSNITVHLQAKKTLQCPVRISIAVNYNRA